MALTFDEKLDNFKSLLEYFVSHLEWEVNRDPTHIGYGFYIRPLLERKCYYSSGQGQQGDAIQQQIEPWAHRSTSRASGPLMPKLVQRILLPSLSLMLPALVPPLILR